MNLVLRSLVAASLLALTGCARTPGAPGAAAAGVIGPRAQGLQTPCDASLPLPAPAARRLSVREYQLTLRDLFASYESMEIVDEELSMELRQLPRDGEAGASFSNMDTRQSQRHVDTFVKVAESAARAATRSDERLAAIAGQCALAPKLDAACYGKFVNDFGRRAWRRPLDAAETGRLAELARGESPRDAYRRALTELLAAPAFVFHVETAASGGAPYALASRLAYHFWQTMPDERLYESAASGALETESGYRAEVERLVRHQRARATWFRFFREWLQLDEFGGFSLDRAFANFAGQVKATPELYDDAVWEVEQLVGYYTFDTAGSYRDLLSSDLVVTRSPRLASLYGVEPWDGLTLPRSFPKGQRSGLLTRAAVLISGSHATNPFHRGAFVRRRLLCEPIEPPPQRPPEAFVLPVFDPRASTRTRYERKVEQGGCKGCHDLFSPYGYALEAYDALGRHRTSERLVDDAGDAHGRVDLAVNVSFSLGSAQVVEADGPVALSAALAASDVGSACFARQYFRFTFRRMETPADACTVNFILSSLNAGGLLAAYRDVAFSDGFRQNSVATTQAVQRTALQRGKP